MKTRVILKGGEETFSYSYSRTIKPGFTALYTSVEFIEYDIINSMMMMTMMKIVIL